MISNVWEVPVGRNRRFLGSMPLAGEMILGGWRMNGVTNFYSGLPFTPSSSVNTLNGSGGQRPDRLRDGNLPADERTILRWFDTGAFATPGPFLFGNAGRNILVGPGTAQFDLALAKDFLWSQDSARRVEFRSEFFNLFNHPLFNNPNATTGSAQAGIISAAGSKTTFQRTSRQIQFALKLYW